MNGELMKSNYLNQNKMVTFIIIITAQLMFLFWMIKNNNH
jgi:hypothetical protein